MDSKIGSCFYTTEGIYTLLNDSNYYILLNTIFPCSIKELLKLSSSKKQFDLRFISVRSFIKAAAVRDQNYLLSFFYPRGLILKVDKNVIGNQILFLNLRKELEDIGEFVGIKFIAGGLLTVDFYINSLLYGKYQDSLLVVKCIVSIVLSILRFNYILLMNLRVLNIIKVI